MKLSERIKDIRLQSTCKDRRAFAAEVGITFEGLRLIEVGKRIPELETLEKILSAAKPPGHVVEDIMKQWDITRKNRHGLLLANPNEASLLSDIGAKVTSSYLDEMDWDLPIDWVQILTKRMEAAFAIAIQKTQA